MASPYGRPADRAEAASTANSNQGWPASEARNCCPATPVAPTTATRRFRMARPSIRAALSGVNRRLPTSVERLLANAREPGARRLEDVLRRAAADQHVQVAVAGKGSHRRARAAVGLGRVVHALHPLGAESRAREGEDGQRVARAWR